MSAFTNDFMEESGMSFGPFTANNRFAIEKSKLHRSLGDGYKIVEFIALKDDKELVFVEAKPKGYISNLAVPYLDSKIRELTEKFENSIDLFLSAFIGWRMDEHNEIGSMLKTSNYSHIKGKCYLVINGADDGICMGISMALQETLRRRLNIHKLDVIAINDVAAKEYRLIRSSVYK